MVNIVLIEIIFYSNFSTNFIFRLFGGLINDFKRKAPWYFSDFVDALALQSIASVIFLYFACLAPIITFGGLLGDATGKNIVSLVDQ
jgi:hypothetical protein